MIGSRTGAGCPDRGKLVKGEPTVTNGPVPPSSRAFSSARYQCSDIAAQWAQSKAVACHRNPRLRAPPGRRHVGCADQGRRHRQRAVYATASIAPIAEHDIAAVAAKAFLTDDLVGRRVALTGPQALTNTELVEVIGAVLDRPLRYQEAPNNLVRQRFTAAGLSPEFSDAYIAMLSTTVDKPAPVTAEVENILGRPAVPDSSGCRSTKICSPNRRNTKGARTHRRPGRPGSAFNFRFQLAGFVQQDH
jgi:hypothetical protein